MTTKKVERRIKIKFRIRKSVNGTAERPRLSVFRSNKQISAQVINDLTGKTLVAASSLGLEKMAKIDQAKKVGELVAEKIGSIKENITIRRFTRYKMGEGIEKKQDDFAAEVASMVG